LIACKILPFKGQCHKTVVDIRPCNNGKRPKIQ
jgi:hypothetical protein